MEMNIIQKSCKYCGKIHAEGHSCSRKPKKRKRIDEAVKFRNSAVWQAKRQQIKTRDNYLCQVCIRDLYNTWRRYNHQGLQVHHAMPIGEIKNYGLKTAILLRFAQCIMLCATEAKFLMTRSKK